MKAIFVGLGTGVSVFVIEVARDIFDLSTVQAYSTFIIAFQWSHFMSTN